MTCKWEISKAVKNNNTVEGFYLKRSNIWCSALYYSTAVTKCRLTIVSYVSPAGYCSHLSVNQSLTVCWQANRLDVLYTQTYVLRYKQTGVHNNSSPSKTHTIIQSLLIIKCIRNHSYMCKDRETLELVKYNVPDQWNKLLYTVNVTCNREDKWVPACCNQSEGDKIYKPHGFF